MVPVETEEACPVGENLTRTDAVHRVWCGFRSLGLLFAALALFVAIDIAADVIAGIDVMHLVLESVSLAFALLGAAAVAVRLRTALRRADSLREDLERTRTDLHHWRAEAESLLRRLGMALDGQFQRWGLTSAEREIALLILRGLSYKEVASARGTTERTVRHQALAIYRKAGLTGRAEMAAFFLQALLLPAQPAGDHAEPAVAGRVSSSVAG